MGWLPLSGGSALLVALGAALVFGARSTGGRGALPGDPSVLLITVDGLRRDAVGAYGDSGLTPHLDALAAESLVFEDAVTPMADPLAAGATAYTGIHPLRHELLGAGGELHPGVTAPAEVVLAEGYATAAFFSSPAFAGVGLEEGFYVYDPAGSPWRTLSVARRLAPPARASRTAEATTDAYLAWRASHRGLPSLAWVHYDTPIHQPSGFEAGVQAFDEALGRILERLEADGDAGNTLVVVAGAFGWMRGEHGVEGALGLWDELVRVPLVVRAPGVDASIRRVTAQVRLMDIAPTLLAYPRLAELPQSEGVSLLDYATGARERGMWSALVGFGGADRFGSVRLGMRNNGLKYVRDVRTGEEHLFDLALDPSESEDLAATQQPTVDSARGMIAADEAGLRRLLLPR